MRRFIVGALAVFGALSLLVMVGLAVAVWLFLPSRAPSLPDRTVLYLDFREGLPEAADAEPLTLLGLRPSLDLVEVLLALDAAKDDPRVAGVVGRLDGEGPGYAQAQELRDAILALRDAGKFTIAFADSFGEFGPGTRGYYLATAFDEILIQPLGAVGLTGLMIETPLLRGLLDKLKIVPSGGKRGVYKSAAEMFTESELTPATREALEAVLDSIHDQVVQAVVETRGLERAGVEALIDRGPHAADEALAAGLVDRLAFWDDVQALVDERTGAAEPLLPIGRYAEALASASDDAPAVALIQGTGQIQRGESQHGPATGWILGADTIAAALADAIDDPEVRAILFRVDSPGGSAVASETIGHEVERAVQAGKPVIVSMGDVAASGGYWISMHASSITARPATLTGSIGVFAGKPVLDGFWNQIGIRWGQVQRGANADMWSTNLDFDAAGRERLESFLDRTYAAFTEGVAAGRGLDQGTVLAAAEGRVWTGAQAKELGLVDDLGGFKAALARARAEVGAAPDQPLTLKRFPKQRSPLDQLLELIDGPDLLARRFARVMPELPGVLSAPPVMIR
jgi:protease-4